MKPKHRIHTVADILTKKVYEKRLSDIKSELNELASNISISAAPKELQKLIPKYSGMFCITRYVGVDFWTSNDKNYIWHTFSYPPDSIGIFIPGIDKIKKDPTVLEKITEYNTLKNESDNYYSKVRCLLGSIPARKLKDEFPEAYELWHSKDIGNSSDSSDQCTDIESVRAALITASEKEDHDKG